MIFETNYFSGITLTSDSLLASLIKDAHFRRPDGSPAHFERIYCELLTRARRGQLDSIFDEVLHVAFPDRLVSFAVSLMNPQFNGADLSIERNHFGYEPDILAALAVFARGDRTVVDIGSNWGYFPVHLCLQNGFDGNVVAVEPSRQSFTDLTRVVDKCGLASRVRCINKALGSSKGYAMLSEDAWSGNRTLQHSGDQGELVSIDTLDSLGIHDVSFLKVDVEGFEGEVFKGGRELIASSRPTVVFEDWKKQENFASIETFLAQLGYHCFTLKTELEQQQGFPTQVWGKLELTPLNAANRSDAEERLNVLAATPEAIENAADLRLSEARVATSS